MLSFSFASLPEELYTDQQRADSDGGIGDIKYGPYAEIEEVDDITETESVYQISEGPSQD